MKKKILITSTELMMIQFLAPHIMHLSENGISIDIACSNVGGRIEEVKKELSAFTENIFVVNLHRSPVMPDNAKGYRQLKKIIDSNRYDLIWTNEPVMGVTTRLAAKQARKNGTKVLYICHGFHFFNGAPTINWKLYYPIEKKMAEYCDVIATINKEDFSAAKQFKAEGVAYIHGIGINTDRLQAENIQKDIRKELGIKDDEFVIVSVGELNENKNQQAIIRAMGQLQEPNTHYILCGKGETLGALQALARECKVSDNVHFLGYRKDVISILSKADVFAFPTIREGLGLAALEAMYCGLPLITSDARGPVDYMENGTTGYICKSDDIDAFAKAISDLKGNRELRLKMAENNREIVKPFCIDNVKEEVFALLAGMLKE